jgi:hypothetical protein
MLQEEELQLIESVQDNDMQTGTKLFACHKLLKELDNVDTCLTWFRDELPAQLLAYNAIGLLGLSGQSKGTCSQQQATVTAQTIQEAKDYLRVDTTRGRFMRLWSATSDGLNGRACTFNREIAKAKHALVIPDDPWTSFSTGEPVLFDIAAYSECDSCIQWLPYSNNDTALKDLGFLKLPIASGQYSGTSAWLKVDYESSFSNNYKLADWEYVVGYLEQEHTRLSSAIGRQFRNIASAT